MYCTSIICKLSLIKWVLQYNKCFITYSATNQRHIICIVSLNRNFVQSNTKTNLEPQLTKQEATAITPWRKKTTEGALNM